MSKLDDLLDPSNWELQDYPMHYTKHYVCRASFPEPDEATKELTTLRAWCNLAIKMIYELRQDYIPGDLNDKDGVIAIRKLRSRIAELEALTTWQPMETAPKDGMEVLIKDKDGVYMASYRTESYIVRNSNYKTWCVSYTYQDEQGGEMTIDNPMGWMPIPLKTETA